MATEVAAPAALRDGGPGAFPESETDLLSVSSDFSSEFFRQTDDSLTPFVDAEPEAAEELVPKRPPSPAELARRARLRRVVATVVGFAAVMSVAAVGKGLAAGKPVTALSQATFSGVGAQVAHTETPTTTPPSVEAPKPKLELEATEAPKPAPQPEAVKPDAPTQAAAEPTPPPQAAPADAEALKKEALSLLNRGKRKEAIEKAREAIAADPSDALPYLYLGSALQDSGKWKEGIEAYSDCVRTATKGGVNECRQMGGHK